MRTLGPIGSLLTTNGSLQQLIQEAIQHVERWKGDRHILFENGTESEHISDAGTCCFCDPVVVYTDPVTGYRAYLHRTLEA